MEENHFKVLAEVDVTPWVAKKNGLDYLAWAAAHRLVKERYPDATYKVYENESGWPYFTDGQTCWVKTSVMICGIEAIEYLPIMDTKNKAIPLENIDSMAVNKAIQRSLTKCYARHGLGIDLYLKEDIVLKGKAAEKAAELKPIIDEILELGKEKVAAGVIAKDKLFAFYAEQCGSKNPNSIKDLEVAKALLEKVKKL